jgi:alpha-D-xyloside xylohydrolase
MSWMFAACAALACLGASTVEAQGGAARFERSAKGVVVTPARGPAARVAIGVHGDGIIHVVATPRGAAETPPPSLMAPQPPAAGPFTVAEEGGRVLVRTARTTAAVDLADGRVVFLDPAGRVVLEGAAPSFRAVTVEGKRFHAVTQQFNRGTDEGLYGLGQHQNRQTNLNGEDLELAQHNMDIAVPFLVSTRNYGLLWDNNGVSRFGNPNPYRLVGEGMKVASGGKPGFTARYYLGDRLAVTRREPTIGYQYIRDLKRWPEAAKAATTAATGGQNTQGNSVQTQRVVWTGEVTPDTTGTHKFQLYGSSYFKVFVDGRLVLDRWRQNWSPWYANFDVAMTAGKPAAVRIEWEPNQGYLALLHSDPLPAADRHSVQLTSDVARAVDYWFVPGRDMDDVIAGYRQLTGKAVLMPRWAYGFWQSRQRYNTQSEIVDVVKRYRALGIPIDNIVQDWFYWREDDWGSHAFEPKRYPDPAKMVDDIHAMNARLMVSIWPKFYPQTTNFKELDAKGYMYRGNLRQGNKDWVGPGYLNSFYDPYAPEARRIYWRQVREKLADIGVDAWWMDATEPDMHSNLSIDERLDTMGPTAAGPAAALFNSYPLVHVEGLYEGWRAYKPDVRPFILTRSGFGGLQRAGAAIWSGDVASRWYDLHAQISAGVGASMSGIPNWTHDIGGFANETRFSTAQPKPEDLEEWRELNLRWFQFGAFSPLFRSHGEAPFREIYLISPEGSAMRRSMVWYDQLRYRLLPYIYTLAADTWFKDGSIMRGLVMDFPDDAAARRIDDQFLFGRAFLVAPVVEHKARSRSVYLPGQDVRWYDFYSGRVHEGGRSIVADAPFERMPLFVRAGAVVPMGPVRQHVGDKPDAPVTLWVYTGADGAFALYEDDGVSEGYRRGAYARIPVAYDDAAGTLTIGARTGQGFAGMQGSRTMRVRWITPGRALDLDAADTTVRYNGQAIVVRRPR